MEVAALVISIISIIMTLGISWWQISKNKKLNDINLEAELSKDIIKEFLTNKFPNAISEIHFKKQKLTNIAPLQSALNNLRKKMRFFKYCDPSFFEDLKSLLQELEDYIVNNEGRYFSTEDQGEVMNIIRNKMTAIYTLLKSKYING